MSEETYEPITIAVGDQSFRVRATPEERERLLRVAKVADHVLHDVLDSGVVGGARAFAMALFQLAVELEDTRDALRAARAARDERLKQIINRIDDALDTQVGG